MKNTKIILGSLAITAIATGSFLFSANKNIEKSYAEKTLSFESKDATTWALAAEYYRELRKNVNTGQIEEADYAQALQHYKNMPYNKTTAFSFVEEGPDNVGGRTRGLIVSPNDDNLIYAGAVTGGLFVSRDGANTWQRVQGWDNSTELLSISSVAITNDGTIYVATGGAAFEGNLIFQNSGAQRGDGLWYSVDDGATFTQVSGTANKDLTKVVADLSKNDVVYITGSGFGLKKLENKGALQPITATSLTAGTGTQDVKVSPDGSVVVVASGGTVWTSQDGGNSFNKVTGSGAGKINGSSSRIETSVSYEKNGSGNWNCYAVKVLSNGHVGSVWLSEDNGVNWTKIGEQYVANVWDPLGTQGNYDVVISAVKGHPDQCILGGLNVYRWIKNPSTNPAEGSWEALSNWAFPKGSARYIHADIHAFTWNSQGKLFVGSDGGVQASRAEDLSMFYDANKGYNVTQFYGISYGPDGAVIGGAQDNGTQYNNHSGYFSALTFISVNGGDGFDCEISQLDKNVLIASIYNTGIRRMESVMGGGTQIMVPASDPALLGNPGGGVGTFHTPLRLFEDGHDTDTQDSIPFIAKHSYASGDVVNYTSQSLELPLSYTITQDLFVDYDTTFITVDTVTATYDTLHPGDTLLENGVPRDTIMVPDYVQSLFVTHTDLGVFLTRDMLRIGSSMEWWKIIPNSNQAHTFEFSKDGNTLWIGMNGGTVYRVAGLDSAYAFEQADYSYKDSASYKLTIETMSIPGSGVVADISVDKNDPNKVIIVRAGTGSDHVYYSTDAMAAVPTWVAIDGNSSTGLPNIPMYGVEIIANASTNETVIVGTEYGAFVTENINGSATQWTPINNEIGLVPVFDVRQQWRDRNDGVENPYAVYLGTHGRGIWRSDAVLSVDEPQIETVEEELSNIVVYPNPMATEGKIGFELNSNSDVEIRIYDLQGKMVNQLSRMNLSAGNHVVPFDVQELPRGTYILTLKTNNSSEVTKFIKY